jgi:hypothetical protein
VLTSVRSVRRRIAAPFWGVVGSHDASGKSGVILQISGDAEEGSRSSQ